LDIQVREYTQKINNAILQNETGTYNTNFALSLSEIWKESLMKNAKKSVLTTNLTFSDFQGFGGNNYANIDLQQQLIQDNGIDITRVFFHPADMNSNTALHLNYVANRQNEAGIRVRTFPLNKSQTHGQKYTLGSEDSFVFEVLKALQIDSQSRSHLDIMLIDDEIAYLTFPDHRTGGISTKLIYGKAALKRVKAYINRIELRSESITGILGLPAYVVPAVEGKGNS